MWLCCLCRLTGRLPGVGSAGNSTGTVLLNRDDASVGPSEDEEAALLPDGGHSRRTTNGSLDSIFERMESQHVSTDYHRHHDVSHTACAFCGVANDQ